MSDLLEAAAKTLGTPSVLVQRSAAARAAADGTDVDTILAAWAGGEAPPAREDAEAEEVEEEAAPEAEEPVAEAPEDEVEEAPEAPAPQPVPKPPTVEVPTRTPDLPAEPEVDLEPVPLRDRLRAAMRVGAWTGAALGLVGFLVAGAFWAPNAAILEEGGPIVVVGELGVMAGVALISILFGGIVATMSRSAASWINPAMELSMSKSSTGWIGAGLGLVLGLIGGALLTGLGTAVEGSEEGLVQLSVLTTLVIMLLGGAVLGGLTAAVPQLLGTPVTIEDEDLEEVRTVRERLGNAVGIPLVGVSLLALLVLPIAYALIQSNHFLPGVGAPIVGILIAGGILAFAALAGNRPQMRISLGDVMVAVAGIGAVLIVILAVLFYAAAEETHEEEGGSEAAVVRVV